MNRHGSYVTWVNGKMVIEGCRCMTCDSRDSVPWFWISLAIAIVVGLAFLT